MRVLFICLVMLVAFAGRCQQSHTVYFDFNRYNLTKDAQAELDSFLNVADLNETIIFLDGYCDPTGSDNYNKRLSLNRVSTIKKYLLRRGIESGELKNSTGHGEKDPVNENRTEEDRQLNRRVTIEIVKVVRTSLPIPAEIQSLKEKIADSATVAGTNIILRNINFVGGRRNPLPESKPAMDELLAAMRSFPALVIEIQGNICCIEGDSDGPDLETGLSNLSGTRAKAIADWLVYMGIDSNRVSHKGLGHSQPLYPYPEKTEEERKLNRRVEIKIIRK